MCGMLWEASCWSKLSSDKQEHLMRALTEEWDKLPQQLLDNVVQRLDEMALSIHKGKKNITLPFSQRTPRKMDMHGIEAREVHHGKGLDCTPVVSRSFEHHTDDSTILARLHPNLEGKHPGGPGPPTSLPLPPSSQEDLRLDGYLECPYSVNALYVYKHLCILWDSKPGSTTQQSASLTIIPDGRRARE
ncbi:uncharacterized protein TNCV_815211 [Trichonephila clavipes]|nr:uncharacterized protein TNCV_815211 [Trichonephila clavipes]